jgi:hypothetical protein
MLIVAYQFKELPVLYGPQRFIKVSDQSQINPVDNLSAHFCKIHYNTVLQSTLVFSRKVICRTLSAEARVQSQSTPRGIYSGHHGTYAISSPGTSGFRCHLSFPQFSILSSTIWGRCSEPTCGPSAKVL